MICAGSGAKQISEEIGREAKLRGDRARNKNERRAEAERAARPSKRLRAAKAGPPACRPAGRGSTKGPPVSLLSARFSFCCRRAHQAHGGRDRRGRDERYGTREAIVIPGRRYSRGEVIPGRRLAVILLRASASGARRPRPPRAHSEGAARTPADDFFSGLTGGVQSARSSRRDSAGAIRRRDLKARFGRRDSAGAIRKRDFTGAIRPAPPHGRPQAIRFCGSLTGGTVRGAGVGGGISTRSCAGRTSSLRAKALHTEA